MKRFKVLVIAVALAFPCGVNAETNEMLQVLSSKVESLIVDCSNRIEKQCWKIEQEQAMRFEAMLNSFVSHADNTLVKIQKNGESKINAVVTEKGFYEKRYEELKADHDRFMDRLGNWLTLIGILVAVLGFGVPLLISILQNCEVKKLLHQARADIRREIYVSRKAKEREIGLLRRDSLNALHMLVSENFAIVDLLSNSRVDKMVLLASAIVCIHELLECAMRTGDPKVVANEIVAVRAFVDRWANSTDVATKEIWNGACRSVVSAIQSDSDACRRSDYDRVLNSRSENFRWLESFYKDFADWKFA